MGTANARDREPTKGQEFFIMETKEARIKRLKKLRNDKGMLIQEIADMEGVSRERIRQIIGNTGRDFIGKFVENNVAVSSSMTTRQSEDLFGGRGKGILRKKISEIWHRVHGESPTARGVIAEEKISKKLAADGIENKLMPYGHPFDILLGNGKRVEVKTAFSVSKTSPAMVSAQYRFHVRKKEKGTHCDFYVLYIEPTNEFFIVPNSEINSVDHIYITSPKPKRSWGKYHQFKDRFDLLK
jgi:hypothetical protein